MLSELLFDAALILAVSAGIPLIAASISGLLIAVVQSATQIQEQSAIFTVKLASLIVIVWISWGWVSEASIALVEDCMRGIAAPDGE